MITRWTLHSLACRCETKWLYVLHPPNPTLACKTCDILSDQSIILDDVRLSPWIPHEQKIARFWVKRRGAENFALLDLSLMPLAQ